MKNYFVQNTKVVIPSQLDGQKLKHLHFINVKLSTITALQNFLSQNIISQKRFQVLETNSESNKFYFAVTISRTGNVLVICILMFKKI
jgi:hypothetical protein